MRRLALAGLFLAFCGCALLDKIVGGAGSGGLGDVLPEAGAATATPWGLGGIATLLLGWGVYRYRRARNLKTKKD